MEWISVEDSLPEARQAVLFRLNYENWFVNHHVLPRIDETQEHWRYAVGWIEFGRDMDNSGIGDVITSNDQHGNNRKPYRWHTFGASKHFGQDATHWLPIEWEDD